MLSRYFSPFQYIRTPGEVTGLPYSTVQFNCTRSIAFVMYPGIKPFMCTVNTEGQIYDHHTGEQMVGYVDSTGYIKIYLTDVNGYSNKFHLHRIVAYAFCNPPSDLSNHNVNHINGDRTDNRACNLEWITVAANNQHSRYVLNGNPDPYVKVGKPMVTEEFVRCVCEKFVEGKSNVQIMNELGMENNNASHTLLRDLRGGYTWKGITSQYTFDRSSKKHAYTKEQQKEIERYIKEGLNDFEIFEIMQGRPYDSSKDRRQSKYRSIQSRRAYMAQTGRI